jgi:hypothetical protein
MVAITTVYYPHNAVYENLGQEIGLFPQLKDLYKHTTSMSNQK